MPNTTYVINERKSFEAIDGSDLHLASLVRDLLIKGYKDIEFMFLDINYRSNSNYPWLNPKPEDFIIETTAKFNYQYIVIDVSERFRGIDDIPLLGGIAHELGHIATRLPEDEKGADREAVQRGYGTQLIAMKRLVREMGTNPSLSYVGYSPEELEQML